MMDRLFRIDFYPQDWIVDTAKLSLEERGIFIQIVCLIYSNRGPIENDPKWIAGVSGCSTRMAAALILKLSQKGFIDFFGSKITQKRAENELKTKREHFELSSKGGRKTAEKRTEEQENNGLNSTNDTNSVPTPSPSPYPSPSAKEIDRSDNPPKIRKPAPPPGKGYDILNLLDVDGLSDARVYASSVQKDLNECAKTYNAAIDTGALNEPNHPNSAFPIWINNFYKSKAQR